MADTGEVMSWMSQKPLVDKEIASDTTMVASWFFTGWGIYLYRNRFCALKKTFS
jgi:hypothetical protein